MRYQTKLALQIFVLGAIILSIGLYASYRHNYNTIIKHELVHTVSLVDEVSVDFERQLLEKVKTNQTLSITPIIKDALKTSNNSYDSLSEIERDEKKYQLNKKWKATEDEDDAFILEFTNNSVAHFLKEQQNNLKGEYGEIFLTNKYGALVASTAKLTTFKHDNKYWWEGAYNNGSGSVFFDDRGYDESVDGYVLGLVIPIKENNEIIGILKVNLNILGAVSKMLLRSQDMDFGDFKLIRSGGEIIFEKGAAPLSTRVPDFIYKKIQSEEERSFLFEDSLNIWMIGMSEIGITSTDAEGFIFGGVFESEGHLKGNTGESWYIINYRNINTISGPLEDSTLTILIIGLLLIIVLAFSAFIFGKLTAKPLKQLIEQSKKIAKADFSARTLVTRKDEIGHLGNAFNEMALGLEENTTSIENLELEIKWRMLAEEALKESEEAFRVIFEQAAVGVAKVNKYTGDYIKVNQKYLDIVGYSEEELFKLTYKDITHPDDLNNNDEVEKVLQSDKPYTYSLERRHINRDGSICWVKITVSPIYIGDKVSDNLIAIVEDITDRKQTEKALKESEEYFRAVFEQAAVGVIQADWDTGNFIRVNQKYLDIVGYSKEELFELNFKDITHPDDLEKDLDQLKLLQLGEIDYFSIDKRYIRKDGTAIWIQLTVSPMSRKEDVSNYLIAIVEDITESKKAQDELKESELKLREANATKDKFFSIIAHDLRNPFNVILGYSDMLNKGYERFDDDKRKLFINEIHKSSANTFTLLENLLTWTRSQQGRIKIKKEKLNLSELINSSIQPYSSHAKNKGINILNNINVDTNIIADINTMSIVFGNLINNAIKFTHKDGNISISEILNGDNLDIYIEDTGIGMTDKQIADLFLIEKSSTTLGTDRERGSGLGLILCKEFVEKNGGAIRVESKVDVGSKFIISLPILSDTPVN